jgi:hypothetical protein
MYTDPLRPAAGRRPLHHHPACEDAARLLGFATKTEMMATLSGEPLYRTCGYLPRRAVVSAPVDGVTVP